MVLLCVAVGAMITGPYDVRPADVARTLAAHVAPQLDVGEVKRIHDIIIWKLRLPRVLLAIFAGTALAAAGAVFQGCFRNPLVEPYILGVSSGAAFGAALGIVYPAVFASVRVCAFVFALLAVAGAYLLARQRSETPLVTLILAGVIIASVFTALISILKYMAAASALREIVFWLMGGFYFATWKDVAVAGPITLGCFVLLWALGWKLNVLSMGDEEARALGVHPERFKLLFVVLATLGTAVCVASVGVIAWVGLMAPHAARMLLGPDHRVVIPAAALLGAVYLIVCDTLARTLTTAEIPIGIITSLLGAPYLFYLLRTRGRAVFG